MTISDLERLGNYNIKKNEDYALKFRSWAINAFLNTSWVDNPTIDWFVDRINKALDASIGDKAPLVVGVCGNMGCGKDTGVEFFTDNYYTDSVRCTKLAFADPIREIGKIFGFTPIQMSDRTLKETVDERWGISPRKFMQLVGTEMFRNNLREDVWIQLAKNRIAELSMPYKIEIGVPRGIYGKRRIIFVTDVRFPNEAAAIKDIGGIIVKVTRPGFSKSGENLHPSEKFINEMPCDCIIENKADNAQEWQWTFAKWLTIHLKHDAFYDIR